MLHPGSRLGSYEIAATLGAGGMGEVYRATDTVLKRQVAVKVLRERAGSDAGTVARLQREAEVLASLNHPNIATIYGLERAEGSLALVMELVEGPTLADRIASGAIALAEALALARQIAEGLEAAHERGIVHRDLKPANIKVRPDGTVKLLDFGLAKLVEDAGAAAHSHAAAMSDAQTIASPATMTQDGTILGTPAYMSPEQAKGAPADRRSDIWAFGVILAEMVTGRRPFHGDTTAETFGAILNHEPDLNGLPPELRRLVQLSLAKDPRSRLRHIGDALALVDERAPDTRVEGPTRRQWGWQVPAVVLAALAAAAAIAWAGLRAPAPDGTITRFYVDAPPGAAFSYTYTASAVSPDGRQLVFRVTTAAEAPGLWLRPLDVLEGTRLPGTEGADFPFWSADGRFVGFFAAGKLKRVDTNGSTPIVVCDANDADIVTTGASWNRDGTIVFGAPEGLYRVPASGGVPVLFAPVDSGAGETGYGSPQFFPDGERFLFYARAERPDQAGYYVSSLSRPRDKTRVLATGNKALLVASEGKDAYLLYLQNQTVLARGFDPRSLTLTGEPVPIASDVARFPPGFHASFWSSASGNLLAYRTDASDKPRLTWLYPDGKRQPISGTEDFFTHVRVAGDGSRAAVELADTAGNLDVWLWDFARGVKTRQTFDPKPDRGAALSSNAQELAFSSLRTGVWQIFRKDVNSGRPEQQLTTGPEHKILPDFSRDGRYLVFIQIGTTTAEDIWALPLHGNRQPYAILRSPAIETNPALSPDGRWLAFESPHSGRPEVYVTPFPASADAVGATPPRWQVSTQGGSRPRWSSDGRALLYVSLDDLKVLRADVRTSDAAFENDPPKVIGEIPVMSGSRSPFDVAADGRLLLLERTVNRATPLAVVTNWRRLLSPGS